MKIHFVSFYEVADSVTQQIHNCPYKTQTATTGTRPPLVASQYYSLKSIKEKMINKSVSLSRAAFGFVCEFKIPSKVD